MYQEIVDSKNPYHVPNEKMTLSKARALLSKVHHHYHDDNKVTNEERTTNHEQPTTKDDVDNDSDTPYSWGGLSVGPVWKHRLVQAGYIEPTPIQKKAFAAVTKKQNVVVASATGSGKSLAYLLPLLTTTNLNTKNQKQQSMNIQNNSRKNDGMVWIFTPTVELALQLEGVVNTLLPSNDDDDNNNNSKTNAIFHVIGQAASGTKRKDDDEPTTPLFPILSELASLSSMPRFLAGTPRSFQQLLQEMNACSSHRRHHPRHHGGGDEDSDSLHFKAIASALFANLQSIVLDEADRLLQTEAVARNYQQYQEQKAIDSVSGNNGKKRQTKRRRLLETPTEQVLRQLLLVAPPSKPPKATYGSDRYSSPARQGQRQQLLHQKRQFQIICASATIGRTLRRQLMNLVEAPSMDKAAILVTPDVRTKKDAIARKSNLLPTTLQHAYRLVEDEKAMKGSAGGSSKEEITRLVVFKTLYKTLQGLPPEKTLIFPGRIGVDYVQTELQAKYGFKDIRGLEQQQEEEGVSLIPRNDCSDWKTTPIYVVGEKLGRGLDLKGLGYVIMLQVPSSAAGYTHLAGRTGRNGNQGIAISICQPREVPKLVVIAETLGLKLQDLSMSDDDEDDRG